MPFDHFVSQVHLRRFYSPILGNRMYAIRKRDLKVFTPDAAAVCRIMDGSTNPHLREARAIEAFLRTIEPNYNAAVEKLSAGRIDSDCVYTIAGFVAYVITCSPAGKRLFSGPLRSMVETATAMMDARGAFPPTPPELGGASLTDLLGSGAVDISIDPKYPQALGTASILRYIALFGNSKWEILRNDSDDSPFFTSDFPAAIEKTDEPRVLNRIVPVAPNLAVRIKPDISLDKSRADLSFANFSYRDVNLARKEIVLLNRLIVRCAEDLVFYRDNHPWIAPFVAKNRHFRIEPHTRKVKHPNGTIHVFTHRLVASAPL
jgi:hypothetical protein